MPELDGRADEALREGLRALPVPETSPDFAARVRARLERPAPWWRAAWSSARPVLYPAVGSLAATLALLAWLAASPGRPSSGAASAPPSAAVAVAPRADFVAGLRAASLLGGRWMLAGTEEPAPPPPAPQRHLRLPDKLRHA